MYIPEPRNVEEWIFLIVFLVTMLAMMYFMYVWPCLTSWRKGKRVHALAGLIPVYGTSVAWFGALRIGHPDSKYAEEHYPSHGKKMKRAIERYGLDHE